jgi:signal transduction histidine kinase
MALMFAATLFLSIVGTTSLLSMLTRSHASQAGASLPIVVSLVSMLLLMGLVISVVRRIGSPLGDVVQAADRLAAGDFTARVAVRGAPSIRIVGGAFNSMAAHLEAQNRYRRELMADIAHELRTPLTVVQGRLEGLLDGVYARDDEQLREVVEEMRLLSRLVGDLGTLAHAESGTLTLVREPTDLAVLTDEVVRSLSAESARRRIAVRLEEQPDVPPIDVDPLRIREVLVNLLNNALNHTRDGGTVSLAIDDSPQRVTISVSDSGSGISAEDLPKVFDRFYKGGTSRGSGLGLTISRNLIEAHQGQLTVESSHASGTRFTITLPRI